MRLPVVFLILAQLVLAAMGSAEMTLRVGPPASPNDLRAEGSLEILRIALGKEATLEVAEDLPPERARAELKEGNLDVWATATRADWERELLPVRIPILQGLLGARVFLIRDEDRERFSDIESLDELRRLQAGLGAQWSITSVLRRQGFAVRTSDDYESLFAQLAAGRFDYFPRGVTEAPDEHAIWSKTYGSLAIERSLLLYVPLPKYFFVSPARPEVAERLEARLETMVADGTLRRMLLSRHGEILQDLALDDRRILRLENPELSPETPLDRPELWLDLFSP